MCCSRATWTSARCWAWAFPPPAAAQCCTATWSAPSTSSHASRSVEQPPTQPAPPVRTYLFARPLARTCLHARPPGTRPFACRSRLAPHSLDMPHRIRGRLGSCDAGVGEEVCASRPRRLLCTIGIPEGAGSLWHTPHRRSWRRSAPLSIFDPFGALSQRGLDVRTTRSASTHSGALI